MGFEDNKSKIKEALKANSTSTINSDNANINTNVISKDNNGEKTLKQLLESSPKKRNIRPKQTNVYLDDEVRNLLDKLGEALGKENGGKSKIVNDALRLYFKQNDIF